MGGGHSSHEQPHQQLPSDPEFPEDTHPSGLAHRRNTSGSSRRITLTSTSTITNDDDHGEARRSAKTSMPSSSPIVVEHDVGGGEKSKVVVVSIAVLISFTLLLAVIVRGSHPKHDAAIDPCTPDSANTAFNFPSESTLLRRRKHFMAAIDAANIQATSREYSSEPHIAGSKRNNDLAEVTARKFRDFGFEDVRVESIPVLMANLTHRSVNVTDASGTKITYKCSLEEENLNINSQKDWNKALKPSNGYTGAGRASGPVVWANYGRDEDYKKLDALGVSLKGAVVVTRYGKIFRGQKVKLAQMRGAVAVLIAQDPGTVGYAKGKVFKQGPWANNVTVQRGSVYTGEGDPLTPSWPSQRGGPVLSVEEAQFDEEAMNGNPLPAIPVQPIGYGDAKHILKGLNDNKIPLPVEWYDTGFKDELLSSGGGGRIGPGPQRVDIEIRRTLQTFTIKNVMATIRGDVEPDRTVLIGSHRDAWTYGAVDPISAQSITIEIARVLGSMHTQYGWRPRRTIQVCSWDAEEWGILGSDEYVETNIELLRQRAVAYLNLDTAVSGNDMVWADGSPLLEKIFMSAMKDVPNPNPTSSSSSSSSSTNTLDKIFSKYRPPGAGTDHVGFIQLAGVPVLSAAISSKDLVYEAVYHSNYDSTYWLEHFVDPGYQCHAAVAKLFMNILLHLSEPVVLPLHVPTYSKSVKGWVGDYTMVPKNKNLGIMTEKKKSFGGGWPFMSEAITIFQSSADNFAHRVAKLKQQISTHPQAVNPFEIRAVNDISMGVERVFLAFGKRETGQEWFKHVIFTPSAVDSYSATVMPLIALGLATNNASKACFAIGRVAQFVFRAGAFVNSSDVMPPFF